MCRADYCRGCYCVEVIICDSFRVCTKVMATKTCEKCDKERSGGGEFKGIMVTWSREAAQELLDTVTEDKDSWSFYDDAFRRGSKVIKIERNHCNGVA